MVSSFLRLWRATRVTQVTSSFKNPPAPRAWSDEPPEKPIMIRLTRLHGEEIFVNVELIKFVEALPDTLLTFTDGDRLHVHETPQEVARKVLEYRRQVYQPESADAKG
jgi:flagellar protein FlbD